MIKTNSDKLVKMSVSGKVSPSDTKAGESVTHNGVPFLGPGTGGICYNVLVGDSVFGWAGDHIEPGVSTRADKEAFNSLNASYNFLACIGNEVRVVSGEAKGAKGVVTGKHGGSERIMIDFPQDVMEQLTHDDTFMIKTCGQGLKFDDFPGGKFRVMNIDPGLLGKMYLNKGDIGDDPNTIYCGVTHIIPGEMMGSGIGSTKIGGGDYDITTQDEETMKACNLSSLRLGDIVAIDDHDNIHGRCFKRGYISIGVVIHCDSVYAGHGPGVTTIMSAKKELLVPVVDNSANIAKLLGIGVFS